VKAIVYEKFVPIDVFESKEIENPTPKNDDLLVKVHAISINAIDIISYSGSSLFLV
jgi:NADPH:quinone reductase-like Zn-dependent oxidoreductase